MKEEAVALLQAISDKLGIATEILWSAYLKQAPIWGSTMCIVTIAEIIISVFLYMKLSKVDITKFKPQDDWQQVLYTLGIVLLFGIVCSAIVIFVVNMNMLVAAFFNPEYWAINNLLNTLKVAK